MGRPQRKFMNEKRSKFIVSLSLKAVIGAKPIEKKMGACYIRSSKIIFARR